MGGPSVGARDLGPNPRIVRQRARHSTVGQWAGGSTGWGQQAAKSFGLGRLAREPSEEHREALAEHRDLVRGHPRKSRLSPEKPPRGFASWAGGDAM